AVTPALDELAVKIGAADPYIKGVRVGRFKPGTVRLVFDLKAEAKPEVFVLRTIAEYGHRLVLDIYPAQAVDPLLALIDKSQTAPDTSAADAKAAKAPDAFSAPQAETPRAATSAPSKPATRADAQRLLIVALDAGHGGEDPGAKGRRGTFEKNVTLAIA